MPKQPTDGDVMDIFDAQIKSQGVGCIAVSDGQVFTFTDVVLEMLLKQAKESPERKVVVFVKRSPQQ